MSLKSALPALRCQLEESGCEVPPNHRLRGYLKRAAAEVWAATGCPCGCRTTTETYTGAGESRIQLRGCCIKGVKSVTMRDAPHWVPIQVREGYGFVLDHVGGLCWGGNAPDTGCPGCWGGGCGSCCSTGGWPKGCQVTVTYVHGRDPEPDSLLECGLIDIAERIANDNGCKPSGPVKSRSIGDFSETFAIAEDTAGRIVSGRFVTAAIMSKLAH